MKILLIQLRQLGDVLLSTPLARVIKEKIQGSTVHFLTSDAAEDIVKDNPYIDKILTLKTGFLREFKTLLNIRRERYDAIADVQRTGRSKRLTLFSNADLKIAFYKKGDNFYYNRLIEWKDHGYTSWERMELLRCLNIKDPIKKYLPEMYLDKTADKIVKEYLKKHDVKKFFIVAPTARKENKMWNPEYFGRLANLISQTTGLLPIIVYGPNEKETALKCFNILKTGHIIEDPFSIKEFAGLVYMSEFIIGNDSFASHIGTSLKKKSIVILGPTSGWFVGNKNTLLVTKGLDCQPCGNYENCRHNLSCYRSLMPEDVFEKIREFIKNV